MNPAPQGPLAGLRVVDMTAGLTGPYATQLIGDLGAEVIGIEPPEGGGLRRQGPARHPSMGSRFLRINRGKRGIAVDLETPGGRAAVFRLCERADVFLHDRAREAMRRLGLAYEDVSAANPRIVYCGVSAFGEGGPYSGRPAADETLQGLAAIAAVQARLSGAGPRYLPFAFADRAGALALVNAILAALLARNRTGRGQAVGLSVFEALSEYVLSEHMWGHTFEPPIAGMGMKRIFDRRPAPTRDGFLCYTLAHDGQVARFWRMTGRDDLAADARFATREDRNRYSKEFYDAVDAELARRTTAEWLQAFEAADLPAMPAQALPDLFDDPQLRAAGLFKTVEHPTEGAIVSLQVPTKWSKTPPRNGRHAPALGEHTVEVLLEAGYGLSEVEAMIAAQEVYAAAPQDRAGGGIRGPAAAS
ncbi:CoA transferase [Pigmentiphaga soli]|uniref:CoA transferase n=1 Tax=Pigmentiphaga soli TaxID=1007095 RepID=A0ABP8HRW5_9BURK